MLLNDQSVQGLGSRIKGTWIGYDEAIIHVRYKGHKEPGLKVVGAQAS